MTTQQFINIIEFVKTGHYHLAVARSGKLFPQQLVKNMQKTKNVALHREHKLL